MLQVGDQVGAYRVEAMLGVGGMGAVYRARDLELDREVALKVISRELAERPGYSERFLREARAVARLNHKNIPVIYAFGWLDDAPYMASEYLNGGPLSARLERDGITWHDALEILAQVAAALDHAHEHGVIHRDVKPANVVFDDVGCPHLIDFGIALTLEPGLPRLTSTDELVGTLGYCSKEQLRGDEPAASMDIFALAVVAHELLTGELPREVAWQVSMDRRASSDSRRLPAPVEAAIRQSLDDDPEKRHASCTQLARAIASELGSEVPVPAAGPSREGGDVPAHTIRLASSGSRPDSTMLRSGRGSAYPGWVTAMVIVATCVLVLLETVTMAVVGGAAGTAVQIGSFVVVAGAIGVLALVGTLLLSIVGRANRIVLTVAMATFGVATLGIGGVIAVPVLWAAWRHSQTAGTTS